MLGTEIVRNLDMLKAERSNIEQIWNDVERFIMPLRIGNMYQRETSESSVEWEREDIYDSTAIFAGQRFASSIHGTITNPAFKWFEFLFKSKKLRQDKVAAAWLQECTEITYEALYDSNFDSEISSGFQDLVGLGNSILVTEVEAENPVDWKGFNFTAVPLKESFFERDHRGNLFRFYRWLEWTAREIKSKWPKDVMLPESIEACLKEGGNITKRFAVAFCIYERPDKRHNQGVLTPLASSERPYGAKYVLKMDGTELGEETGYYEMPAHHCPWEKSSGSKWGHGPGMVMVPTVKYINDWMELQDMSVRKMLDPPSLVRDRGLMSDLDQKPGGMTVVRDPERDVKPYLSGARIDYSQMSLKELREMVREAFHDNELQLKESPQMSATEAQIRYELMNRVLGPTMGRIQNNMLDPALMRVFMAQLRNKQFPPTPEIVIRERAQYKVHYSGPLVRAQRVDEVSAIERFIGQIGAMAKVFPPILNVIDPVKVAREMAERLAIPAGILRSDTEVKQMQQQQQQAAQALTQAKVAQEHGAGMKALGEGQAALGDNGNGAAQ